MEIRIHPRLRLKQRTVNKNTVHFPLGLQFPHRGNLSGKRIHEFDLLVEVFQKEPLRYVVQFRLPESGNYFLFPCQHRRICDPVGQKS